MARTNRFWIPVLVGLLVAVLLGPAGVTATEPRVTVTAVMVPAAAFIPASDTFVYGNGGRTLSVLSGHGSFTAPLFFPVPVVRINRITLYAFDNSSPAMICVQLFRTRPAAAAEDEAGQVCSGNSAIDPQVAYTTAIDPRQVGATVQGAYLWVYLSDPGVRLYGVKVNYSYDTGA